MAESLAEVFYAYRFATRLSQEALAERAGLSARTVSDIETGVAKTPRTMTLVLLAEALGLAEAERARLLAAGRRGEPEAAAPQAGAIPALRVVPLIGRDDEVERLGRLLTRDGARLVTLVGPAGVGKTSLALRVAYEHGSAFAHGAAVVELAAIGDPSLVPAAVAKAVGVREAANAAVRNALVAHLKKRTMLLVLDNLEHLTPAAPWIGELLTECPLLSVVATSRELLHLRAETVFAVAPLNPADAMTLFVERARSVKPEFALTEATSSPIATIVEHLEGLPLAIELAAARLNLLPPNALAARLERRLPLLGGGPIDAPQRQRTMQGAIAWSYDLLSTDEQTLFRRLGVFRGGAGLEGARAVVSDGDDAHAFLLRIASLVDKSLVVLDEDALGEPRIAMLELLREFAVERLETLGELPAMRERHARDGVRIAAAYEADAPTAQARALARLDVEHPNLIAALAFAHESGDLETALRLAASLWYFWWMQGWFSEGIGWLRRVLDLAGGAPAVAPRLHARAMRGLVSLLSAAGNLAEALRVCEDAIARLRRSGEPAGLASLLTSLGTVQQFRGELERAEMAHVEALALRREIGDEMGIAISLANLSSVTYTRGDMDRADAHAFESVALYRRLGHQSGHAHALMKLGLVAIARGELDRAEAVYTESRRIQRSLGDRHGGGYSLANLGAIAHKRGATAQAIALLREALEIMESANNQAAIAKLLEDIAVAIGLGDPERGVRLLGAAETLRQTLGAPLFPAERADYDAEVGRLRAALGDAAFGVQWQIGLLMPIERALAEAREHDGGAARERATPPSRKRDPVM